MPETKTRGDIICHKLAMCRHSQIEEVARVIVEREPELAAKLHRLLGLHLHETITSYIETGESPDGASVVR